MKIIEVQGHTVEIYDTAESMTMKRYQRFNKYLMIDNEVGNDFADFNNRMSKAVQYLKKGLKDEAVRELDNWRQMVYNAFMEYSPQGMALAILVHKIDGEVYDDITASGLQKVLDKLEVIGFTQETATNTVSEVKKKIETELNLYYPNEFSKNLDIIEYNVNLKKLLELEFGKLAGDEVSEKEIDNKEREILLLDTPNIWNIHNRGNMEIEMEAEFEKFMLAVGEHTSQDIDKITIFRFYALLGYIKEKNKPKK